MAPAMRMLSVAATLGLLSLATPSAAAQGFYLTRSTPESWTIMEPAAIPPAAGMAVRSSWTVTVKKNLLDTGPPQPGYVRTLKDYDCERRRVLWRSISAYSRVGALVIKRENEQTSWDLPPANAEDEGELRLICDGAGGKSVVTASSLTQLVITLMSSWDPPAAPAVTAPAAGGKAPNKRSDR